MHTLFTTFQRYYQQDTQAFLGYLGALPFLFLLALYIFHPSVQVLNGFILYSIGITNFVAGSLWRPNASIDRTQYAIMLPSLLIPLCVLSTPSIGIICCILSYLSLYMLQRCNVNWAELLPTYQTMRNRVTVIVIVLHGVLLTRAC